MLQKNSSPRGSGNKDKKAVHLLSALLHKEGVVIAQKEVDSKTNEIKAFKPLLENIDIKGKIVTADAMNAHVLAEKFTFLPRRKNLARIISIMRNYCGDFDIVVSYYTHDLNQI